MKNSFFNKKLMSILFTLIWCFSIVTPIYATGGILTSTVAPEITDEQISGMVNTVLGYLQFGCWAVAIGMIIYVGIKYMMASANDKADLKNASIRYIIGALMIGSASSIFAIIWKIASEAAGTTAP